MRPVTRPSSSRTGALLLFLLLLGLLPALATAGHPLGGGAEEESAPEPDPDAPGLADPPAELADPDAGEEWPVDDEAGPLERLVGWVLQTQRQLHRDLTQGLHGLRDAPSAQAGGLLILVSFLYGVFHAAGPGHGKAVITTYLLTQPQNLRRGIALSTLSALAQGLTAILLVGVLVGILGWLTRETLGQVRHLEVASFALVGLLGVWLMWRGLRQAWRRRRAAANAHHDPGHHHEHAHDHDHGHDHDHDCGCGTPHHVDPDHRGTWWGTVLAVGIRPCSGAVLILAVSVAVGLVWAGVAAVLAMSLGTAITVSVLAALAVYARDWTRRRFAGTRAAGLTWIGPAFGLAGGAVIAVLGFRLVLGAVAAGPAMHPLGM